MADWHDPSCPLYEVAPSDCAYGLDYCTCEFFDDHDVDFDPDDDGAEFDL